MNLDKEEIKKRILQEIDELSVKIKKLIELTKPISPDCAIGRVSRMDAINNKSINENVLRKAESKLKSMVIALKNIDDSDFGICANCTNQIPLGRILLVPHSRFCVHCAS